MDRSASTALPQVKQTTYLKDYEASFFSIPRCTLDLNLRAERTEVIALYEVTRAAHADPMQPLVLDGEELELMSIELDGNPLDPEAYQIVGTQLFIETDLPHFQLRIVNRIQPAKNTALSGLYQSGDMLCTQCEAEGFRRITYSLDRPDVLTEYTVTLRASKTDYPVLLCNGNLIDAGENDTQHWTRWHDPFPKPTYLFALVAGTLSARSGEFVTMSGRKVDLHIFTRPNDLDKSQHALDSLIRSMRWDEEKYGREYDLGVYHIVAVNDFNMGAMENKSLNIFNTKYVLASPDIATDADYHNIEGVIGHEYFHNWSGNRVTCRDWFQLSLKEGFTVLRDQQFSADMGSAGVQRVNDVNILRNVQFREDAGPMAHPVRPESYEEINNFYTATVYNKGAEVVRMLATLLGESTFRQGADLYFSRFDGQAVTTDDFVACMAEVSGRDLSVFKRWYQQSGTPEVCITADWQENNLSLHVSQETPPTPGQDTKAPFHIPIRLALFSPAGEKLPFSINDETLDECVLELTEPEHRVVLHDIASDTPPLVSALRGFSAPVKLRIAQSADDLARLMAHDDDPFNRWDAGQRLANTEILRLIDDTAAAGSSTTIELTQVYLDGIDTLLKNALSDPAITAQTLTPPSESVISQSLDVIDPATVHQARERLLSTLADTFNEQYIALYNACQSHNTGKWTQAESAYRSLRDHCLAVLSRLDNNDSWQLAETQFANTRCMTDTAAALNAIASSHSPQRDTLLHQYYQRWQHEPLVVNKWLTVQALSHRDDTLDIVKSLTNHPGFDAKNPNSVYALLASFMHGNTAQFHQDAGYEFGADWVVKTDAVNPQVASRLVSAFNSWRRFDKVRQDKMQAALERIVAHADLSSDVGEIARKALEN